MDKCSQLNHLVGLDKYGRAFAPQAGVRPDRQGGFFSGCGSASPPLPAPMTPALFWSRRTAGTSSFIRMSPKAPTDSSTSGASPCGVTMIPPTSG